jgi:hypothetical protein
LLSWLLARRHHNQSFPTQLCMLIIHYWPTDEQAHIHTMLMLMFLSPPLRGAGPMALMLGHEWQHIYIYIHTMCACKYLISTCIYTWCVVIIALTCFTLPQLYFIFIAYTKPTLIHDGALSLLLVCSLCPCIHHHINQLQALI